MVDPRLEDVRAAYDAIAVDYAAAFPGTEPEAGVDLAMLDHFVALLRGGSRPRVLDGGCGTGRMSRRLAEQGCEVVGVDVSAGMLAMARRDGPGNPVHRAGLTALPFAEASFDGVLLWYSLIHVPDRELPLALGEAARVLRPGGLVLTAFQKGSGTWDVGRGLRDRGHDVTLVRHHRGPKEVLDALAVAGFTKEARLVREPVGHEDHGQVFLLARRA